MADDYPATEPTEIIVSHSVCVVSSGRWSRWCVRRRWAQRLGRDRSKVYRGLAHGGGFDGYCPRAAHRQTVGLFACGVGVGAV